MTIYLIDVHVITHTCPGDPNEPHAIDTRRTIVHTTPGRPCLTPVVIHSGDRTVAVDCGSHEPYDRQCINCRTIITTRNLTTEHLGYQRPAPTDNAPSSGLARNPCDVCRQPLAAVLADSGRHILCHPRTRTRTSDAA